MNFSKKTGMLLMLTAACAFLSVYLGLFVGLTSIYTHFFYIPVLLACLWYGRKSVYVAITLGSLYVLCTYLHFGYFADGVFERAIALLIVAFFTGMVADRKIKAEKQLSDANEILAQSEEKYRSLVEFTDDPICLVDKGCRYLSANKKLLSQLGLPKEQILEKNFAQFHAADEAEEFAEKVAQVFATGRVVKYEPCTNNLQRWIVRSLSPIKHPDADEVSGVSVIAEDVTEHKKMEEMLRQRTYELGERVKELHCLFAISSLVEKANNSVAEILQGTVELLPPAMRDPEHTCARITLAGGAFHTANWRPTDLTQSSPIVVQGEQVGTLEVGLLQAAAERVKVPFLKEEIGLLDAVTERLGKIIARDRTEKEKDRLEAQLRQFQKLETIGSLAGGIAHDFNNILTPIIGYSELSLEFLPESNPVRSYLREVLNAAMRAKELVQQILTFSRQSDQELKPIRVQAVIEEALGLLRASLPATIQINQQIDETCGAVLADSTQLHQVIMNLCTNAYHAMGEKGGVLGVTLKEVDLDPDDLIHNLRLTPGPHLILSVSDTGHGMERGVVERIFDPYFTTKAPGKGTGIGLSVVHGIVKSYGGDITVYSEVGTGTVFNIYLPIHKVDEVAVAVGSQESLPTGNEHILLVDDEEPIVGMVRQMLEHLGYRVTARTSSIEALEAFRGNPKKFDLVVTDQTMPNLTGAQLTKKLLAIRPDIPIILCTGFSEVLTEKKARALGIREYVMKPVLKSGIAKAIRKALE